MKVSFFVPGLPRSAGSKTGQTITRKDGSLVMNYKTGKPLVITRDAGKYTKRWQATVSSFALQAYRGIPTTEPVYLKAVFVMPYRKDNYGTGRNAGVLKATAPHYHISRPDRGKLVRALEDALTGIIWRDDSQVCLALVEKIYGERPGVKLEIETIDERNYHALEQKIEDDLFTLAGLRDGNDTADRLCHKGRVYIP